jgi:hypothetical protein
MKTALILVLALTTLSGCAIVPIGYRDGYRGDGYRGDGYYRNDGYRDGYYRGGGYRDGYRGDYRGYPSPGYVSRDHGQ